MRGIVIKNKNNNSSKQFGYLGVGLLFLVVLFGFLGNTECQSQLQIDEWVDDCQPSQWYNYATGTCETCGSNMVPTADKSTCVCSTATSGDNFMKVTPAMIGFSDFDPQNKRDYDNFYDFLDIIGTHDSNSNDFCVSCDEYDFDCFCTGDNDAVIFYDQDGTSKTINTDRTFICRDCEESSYASEDRMRCIPCPDELMIFDSSDGKTGIDGCKCQGDFVNGGDICVREEDIPEQYNINSLGDSLFYPTDYTFIDDDTEKSDLNSDFLKQYFIKSLSGCTTYQDPQSCNLLANMCVMNLYDATSDSSICRSLQLTKSETTLEPKKFNAQYFPSPWLYYRSDIQDDIENDRRFQADVVLEKTLKSENEVYFLEYYIAVYDIYGNFEDWRVLGTDFMLCPSSVADGSSQRKFGTDFQNSCSVSLQKYINNYEMKFYELYVKDTDGTFKEIPVLVKNMISGGDFPTNPNEDSDSKEKVYVRRFFIFDNIMGREGSYKNTDNLLAVRYAKSINIQVRLQDDVEEKIFVPIITIEYAAKELEAGKLKNKEAEIEYVIEYYYNPKNFWTNANALFTVFLIFGFILWFIKVYIWYKENPQLNPMEPYTMYFVSHSLCIGMDIFADIFFYLLIILSGYWFIFFKMQERSFVLLPSLADSSYDDNYYYFDVVFWVMFGFKCAGMIYLVFKQQNIDIFFIDWERTKEKVTQEKEKDPGVSVWRNLFVANEFNELSVVRTVEIEWALFFLGLFMSGLKFENLAAETPDFEFDDDAVAKIQKNYVLKYFVASFIFLMIGLVQLTIRKLFVFRYPLQIQDFNDLMSVANVSILILDSTLHGYYMHGRAPIGISEGNSQWLDTALIKEAKANKTRGFIKGTELQSFEILVSIDFKQKYNHFKQTIEQTRQQTNNQLAFNINQQQTSALPRIPKATPQYGDLQYQQLENGKMNLQENLKQILADVETNAANHVVDKNIFQRLFGYPAINPQEIKNLPYFYKDPEYSIQKTIYMGQELSLIIFDIIVYCMWDIVFDRTLVAVVLTYVFDKFFEGMRQFLGKRNIATKSVVDEMFLN